MGSLNVLDIAIVAILLIFAIAGFAKGFLHSLLKLFSSIASLAIGVWLARPVAVFINGFYDLSGFLAEKIGAALTTVDALFNFTVGVVEPGVPWGAGESITGDVLKTAINGVEGLNIFFKNALSLLIKDTDVIANGTLLADWFGSVLGGIAMLIIAAIAVYIAIRIAVGILSKIFDAITKNPAIGGLDHLLGLVFGAAKGALLIIVIFAIYSTFLAAIPLISNAVSPILDGSMIGNEIYNQVSEFIANQIGQIDFNAIIQGLLAR